MGGFDKSLPEAKIRAQIAFRKESLTVAADWAAIKKEYISGSLSLAKLADKYGVSITTLKKKCAREKWSESRHRADTKKEKRMVSSVSEKKVKKESSIQGIADGMIDIMKKYVECGELDPDTLVKLIRGLKDLKEIKHDLTDYELREQKAKIAALEKQIEGPKQQDNEIKIEFVNMDF